MATFDHGPVADDVPAKRFSDDTESANEAPLSSSPIPDGGHQAWLAVLGSWCCMFASFGWITCIGVFQDHYQRDQLSEYSASAIAWIPSTETFIMFAGAPVCGKIFDSYGPMHLVLLGTTLHVFGLMMVSVSTQYYQFFLSQSVCSAIGASALFWASNNSVGTWFRRRRALAFGIVSSGSSVGGVVGT
jgi:MFS family permease